MRNGMRSSFIGIVAAGIVALTSSSPAFATPVRWNILGTYADGGTVKGWFIFDADIAANDETSTAAVTGWNITTTVGKKWPYLYNPFGKATYKPTNSYFLPSACCGPGGENNYLFTFNVGNRRTLGFAFNTDLSNSGGIASMIAGYEYSNPTQSQDVQPSEDRAIICLVANSRAVPKACNTLRVASVGGAGNLSADAGSGTDVPEPATAALLIFGLAGIAAGRRRIS